jgi:hypothetical protein
MIAKLIISSKVLIKLYDYIYIKYKLNWFFDLVLLFNFVGTLE